jgi:hypothetical protein
MAINVYVGKTSYIALGFPRLFPTMVENLANLLENGVIPLSPTLNNKNNLIFESKLYRREGVD